MDSPEELERRRRVVASGATDLDRWKELGNFRPEWDVRAEAAGRWIGAGSTVLDLGCGKMAIERYLLPTTIYVPSDIFERDNRTIICDLNDSSLPRVAGVQVVTALGVGEYLTDLPAFYRNVAALQCRFITSYHPVRLAHPIDRPAYGWVNSFSLLEWLGVIVEAGFDVRELVALGAHEYLIACDPPAPNAIP